MVPKGYSDLSGISQRFGTILFNMVPKVHTQEYRYLASFGTILFNMVPKEGIAINNIFCYNIYRVLEEL